jgi:hypothetical protein
MIVERRLLEVATLKAEAPLEEKEACMSPLRSIASAQHAHICPPHLGTLLE